MIGSFDSVEVLTSYNHGEALSLMLGMFSQGMFKSLSKIGKSNGKIKPSMRLHCLFHFVADKIT